MRISIRASGAVAVALLATACVSGGSGGGSSAPPAVNLTGKIQLVSYNGCDDMLAGLRAATARNVGAWGIGSPPMRLMEQATAEKTADTASVGSYSTTNVHEAGVDEPDLVKTDGARVVVVTQGVLRVIDTATRKVTGELRLVPKEQNWMPADLLLSGNRALVLMTHGGDVMAIDSIARVRPGPLGPKYVLVDLTGKPTELASMSLSGSHVDARMVGTTVRIVVKSAPDIAIPEPKPNASAADILAANKAAVENAPIGAWLPKFEVKANGVTTPHTVKCENVTHPAEFTGTSLLTVHTLDLNGSFAAVEPISVVADGDTVYGTKDSLYVTSNPQFWFMPMPIPDVVSTPTAQAPTHDPEMPTLIPDPVGSVAPEVQPSHPDAEKITLSPVPPAAATPSGVRSAPAVPEVVPSAIQSTTPIPEVVPSAVQSTAVPEATPPPERTEVHRFDITAPGSPRYVSSGSVPGRLLNQYSLSEHAGHLRIATTDTPQTANGKSESAVYVLKSDTLAQVGSVTGLGKDEQIYSVRFIGDLGYVVTFRQVDPLYALDLRDPSAPKVTGELKITGYSAYLHPAGPGRLIGVGQEATTEGRQTGTQVSLFDVADPAAPKALARFVQEQSGSDAEWDPHAFLYWPESGLAMMPLMSWGDNWSEGSSALVLHITDTQITKLGTIKHPKVAQQAEFAPANPGIRRCLIIGNTIWTVSDLGLKINDSTTLTDQTWLPFT
ncbi:beta-propeller domain-containing protein [Acrocarpospora sp. B8E8]|uniref:beta-propeller domain-containing protein n=1 Tax=Acrocarpospora sp. B8E8 TaxID=3153572 RepID=UPI00325CD8BB